MWLLHLSIWHTKQIITARACICDTEWLKKQSITKSFYDFKWHNLHQRSCESTSNENLSIISIIIYERNGIMPHRHPLVRSFPLIHGCCKYDNENGAMHDIKFSRKFEISDKISNWVGKKGCRHQSRAV